VTHWLIHTCLPNKEGIAVIAMPSLFIWVTGPYHIICLTSIFSTPHKKAYQGLNSQDKSSIMAGTIVPILKGKIDLFPMVSKYDRNIGNLS